MAAVTRYSGKVVVVTGGGRGIGAGIVRAFVDSGAQVVFCDKDEARGRALEQELVGTVFVPCDVTQERDLQTLISETLSRFGRLDCVVNNAGYHPPAQWPEETSAQDFRQLLELNLLGTYTLTKLALPHLRKYRGNIINISSLVGTIGQSQAVTYVATKGAVTAMTKALALDESRHGVRVNCISPGNIWTPLWEELAMSTPDPSATILEGTLAQVLRSEASSFSASHHMPYFEASAKLRLNVDEAFEQLVRTVRKYQEQEFPPSPPSAPRKKDGGCPCVLL